MPGHTAKKRIRWLDNLLPVVIRIATIAQNVAVQIANMAIDNAPIYTAVTEAKKSAKNPPATAKDTRNDITMALKVAARTKSIKTNNPVKETRVIVPTCNNQETNDKKPKEIYNIQIER